MHDGRAYPDTLGTECATLDAARVEAVQRIGRLLAEEAARFWTGDEMDHGRDRWKRTYALHADVYGGEFARSDAGQASLAHLRTGAVPLSKTASRCAMSLPTNSCSIF